MTFPWINPTLLGGVRGALFVGATVLNGGGVDVVWPGLPVPGDYALIFQLNSSIISLTGYTSSYHTFTNATWNLHRKRLVAADIATPPTIGPGTDHSQIAIYRGPTSALAHTAAEGAPGASTLDIPGFVKLGGCRGIVNFAADSVGGSGAPGNAPAYMTSRSAKSAGGGGGYASRLADVLVARNYTDSTAFAWTGFDTSNRQAGMAVELL